MNVLEVFKAMNVVPWWQIELLMENDQTKNQGGYRRAEHRKIEGNIRKQERRDTGCEEGRP